MNPNYLDFEQPIADLEVKINELRLVGTDNKLNITDEIQKLYRAMRDYITAISLYDTNRAENLPGQPVFMP